MENLYAAIDIGTNAGRLMIGKVIIDNGNETVQQIQLVRAPLRLGEDVFESGKISNEKIKKFIYTLKSFKLLAKAYGINEITGVATSAMREASNRDSILKKIYEKTKLNIEVIDGDREAELIFKSFNINELNSVLPILFIDVGGGSTELTIFNDQVGKISKSFSIGTIRSLKNKVDAKVWDQIDNWLLKNRILNQAITAVGTGGNINKISQLARKRYLEPISFEELSETFDYLNALTLSERIENLRMNPDRADVIIPATEIYIRIMRMAQIENIIVPKMGLTEGLILEQYLKKTLSL
jgi:exopolyphosphatase / guanosine-5'-triphosphate,3'-diphosphate pyrophosphatase